jgi:hypothetical protein
MDAGNLILSVTVFVLAFVWLITVVSVRLMIRRVERLERTIVYLRTTIPDAFEPSGRE